MPEFISRIEALFVMVVAAVVGAVSTVVAGSEIRALFTGPVTLELPLQNFSPPPVGTLPGAVTGARYSSVEVVFAAVPSHEAWLLAASRALFAVIVLAVCLLVWVLCRQVHADRPFPKGPAWAIGLVGIIVAGAGTFAQALDAAGRNRLMESLGLFAEPGGSLYFLMVFDPVPVVIGLVMALFAAVVRRGRRPQEDAVGLV